MELKELVKHINKALGSKSASAEFVEGFWQDEIKIGANLFTITRPFGYWTVDINTPPQSIKIQIKTQKDNSEIPSLLDVIKLYDSADFGKSVSADDADNVMPWKQYVNAVLDNEGADYVFSGNYTDFKEEEMAGAPDKFYIAFTNVSNSYNALDKYIKSHELIDDEENVDVSVIAGDEGLDYGLLDYGYTWDGVKDEEFHKLLADYKSKREKFNKIIGKK